MCCGQVHLLSAELNTALLRLCKAIPEDWLLDLYNVVPPNRRAAWQQLLQTVESQIEVFTQSYRKFEAEYCTQMLRLLKAVFEPLATMCQEARVLLDKVSTGSLEEKCWTSNEPRLRKAVPLSAASPPARLLRQKLEEQDEETLQESKPRFYTSTALVTQPETSFKSVCEANLLQRLGELYRKGALNSDPDPIDSFDPAVLHRARRIRSFW